MVKHTLNGYFCKVCGGPTGRVNRNTVKIGICSICKEDTEMLLKLHPEYFCKGVTAKGKRCRKVTVGDYCVSHKHQGENKND